MRGGIPLAIALLAMVPASASATVTDVRGEWTLTVESSKGTLHGKALITEEANAQGEFSAHSVTWESVISGTFTGKLEGATATVKTTSAAAPPVLPPGEFNSSTMSVGSSGGMLSLTGSGQLTLGTEELSATETLVRVKTQKQLEEQEAREKLEHEELEGRSNVRGEWTLTLESAIGTLKGTALITEEADATNAFASSSALFEHVDAGTFSGKLGGAKTSVTITTEPYESLPPGNFTSNSIALDSVSNPASMTGTGTFKAGEAEFPATLKATRTLTYRQLVERQKAEQEEKEKEEREAREAAERAAREKQEQELVAKQTRERQEREAREAEERNRIVKTTPPASVFVSVTLGSKALTALSSGSVALGLANSNDTSVHGHVKLALAKSGKASGKKHAHENTTLGEASFSISAHGTSTVKVKLSRSGRAQLARAKAMRVLVTLTTQASGQTTVTKSYTVTLRTAKGHGKR